MRVAEEKPYNILRLTFNIQNILQQNYCIEREFSWFRQQTIYNLPVSFWTKRVSSFGFQWEFGNKTGKLLASLLLCQINNVIHCIAGQLAVSSVIFFCTLYIFILTNDKVRSRHSPGFHLLQNLQNLILNTGNFLLFCLTQHPHESW